MSIFGNSENGDYQVRARPSDSKLYMDPRQHLGLNFNRSRSDLLSLALSNPRGYYALRQLVISSLTEQATLSCYDKMWSILGEGVVQNDDGTETPLVYLDKEGHEHLYKPNLPEVQISKLSMGMAQSILEQSNKIVDLLLPQDYLALSHRQTKASTVASGINI